MVGIKLGCKVLPRCLILLLSAISTLTSSVEDEAYTIKRSDFPNGFLFGTSTSAYQIEGAFQEDGKGLSNWDVYCRIEGSIEDGSNGDFAVDHYHRYMEDIEIMHSLGLTAYRFSISWSRLLPRGSYGEVNQAAILFYNRIIDNLLLRGIEPFVTLFHFELPQELEDRFGSWLSPQMQEEFVHFAKTCFENFGDRVRHWITLNEPNVFAEKAYQTALDPPARCSPPFGHCAVGNSDIEPLIAMHNMMLAHAKAAKLYREQFKSKMDGMLGTTVGAFMYVPLTDDKYDYEATKRAFAFNIGWSLDPLVSGDYPPEMKHIHGPELPRFSSEERLLLKNSIDFIGINHYGALYVKDCIHSSCICHDSGCLPGGDRPVRGFLSTSGERNGVLIGEYTGMTQFYVTPKFMEDMVNYFKEKYQNMPMFITENGYAAPLDENDDYHNDLKRVTFLESYLAYLAKAMRGGADVRGYFVWSLMDNFEWASGYKVKFGIYHIDPATLNRIPKLSTQWYRDLLRNTTSRQLRIAQTHIRELIVESMVTY